MEKVLNVAAHIMGRYHTKYGEYIDEMKLHKLMYFAQRESFVQTGEPLFDATFYGWKYGPILKEIRSIYKDGTVGDCVEEEVTEACEKILDKVFEEYAEKNSWSLSRLTHGETSWKNSRIGIPEESNSDRKIKNDDIKIDANRIKERRKMLSELGLA